MLKIKNTVGAVLTAGEVIPFVVDFNTNRKIGYNASTNEIAIREPGKYNFDINVTMQATATGDTSIALYYDGNQLPETLRTFTFQTVGDKAELTINDVQNIVADYNFDYAKFTIVAVTAMTVTKAEARVEQVR